MARDSFLMPVKTALAKRAGFRCSYPGCAAITVGPSDESSTATANTGEAAHISAASDGIGSRRYDLNMTPAQRSAIENGIWCCNLHAELIDTDEVTYTVDLLQQWRVLAERRAQLRQAYGDMDLSSGHNDLRTVGLAPESIALNSTSPINEVVGKAVLHACLADIAGKEVADALRDFLIEHVRNALTHGNANEVSIHFRHKAVEVVDCGTPFSLSQLSGPNSRGGALAYLALLKTIHVSSVSSVRSESGANHVHIPFVTSPRDLPSVNPCAINIDRAQIRSGTIDFTAVTGCDRIYLVAPDFVVYSDGPLFEMALRKILREHRNVVLVFPNISSNVLKHYKQLFASAEVLSW